MKIKSEPVKTVLTISTGFVGVFLISKMQWVLWLSLVLGIIGIFSPYLSKKVDFLWMKLAYLLSLVVPNIILGIFFLLISTSNFNTFESIQQERPFDLKK